MLRQIRLSNCIEQNRFLEFFFKTNNNYEDIIKI